MSIWPYSKQEEAQKIFQGEPYILPNMEKGSNG